MSLHDHGFLFSFFGLMVQLVGRSLGEDGVPTQISPTDGSCRVSRLGYLSECGRPARLRGCLGEVVSVGESMMAHFVDVGGRIYSRFLLQPDQVTGTSYQWARRFGKKHHSRTGQTMIVNLVAIIRQAISCSPYLSSYSYVILVVHVSLGASLPHYCFDSAVSNMQRQKRIGQRPFVVSSPDQDDPRDGGVTSRS